MENLLDRIIDEEISNITSFYNPMDDKNLQTVSMTELYDQSFQKRPPIIDGLILPGTYIFAGAPKLGKSFLMLQIAYHVATGTDMWGYHAHTPRTRSEREIAGYRDVLNTIHESHDHIPIRPNMILQLHRDLYKFDGYNFGGS